MSCGGGRITRARASGRWKREVGPDTQGLDFRPWRSGCVATTAKECAESFVSETFYVSETSWKISTSWGLLNSYNFLEVCKLQDRKLVGHY